MKKIISFCLYFIAITSISFAHPGGHYSKNDMASLHQWETEVKNEKVIGNFMMSKGNLILIEGIEGKIWRFNVNEMTANDKAFVNAAITNINTKNGINLPLFTDGNISSPWNFNYIFQLSL